ncbi:MAG: T9SS type A sorting domain-containing protein [Ignavibacteriae bacterium]|nr:T9SS type A sorting domain-containing protein [Ignavibacteriota bacterium]
MDRKSLGVEENTNKQNSLCIYPNPTSTAIFLHSELPSETLSLYNILGIIVRIIKTDENGNANINIQDLPSGSYFCRSTVNNSQNAVHPVIAR